MLIELEDRLFNGKRIKNPIYNGKIIENKEGFYAIWINDVKNIPIPFSMELQNRGTNLLYIGIGNSLSQRLYDQELQHKNPATFFRSIGSILGYRPKQGSLVGMKNQHNYKFTSKDTKSIINWINENIEIAFCYSTIIDAEFEKSLIKKYTPILNWTHNPNKFSLLQKSKKECKSIARAHLHF